LSCVKKYNDYLIFIDNTQNLYDAIQIDNIYIERLFGVFNGFDITKVRNISYLNFAPENVLKLVLCHMHLPLNYEINLADETLIKINNSPNTFLWIVSFFEFFFAQDKLLNSINSRIIQEKKVILTTSNSNYKNKIINKVKFTSVNTFWWGFHRHVINHYPQTALIKPLEKYDNLKRAKKKFLCLNQNLKTHRIWTVYHILKENAEKQGYLSCRFDLMIKLQKDSVLAGWYSNINRLPDKDIAEKMSNGIILDRIKGKSVYRPEDSIMSYYMKSLFSIITESDVVEDFVTEKVYKAICCSHPFIIIGSKKYITTLHSLGFQTYEEIFGTSYIDNEHDFQRFVKKIKIMPLDVIKEKIVAVKNKVEYNYNHFLQTPLPFNQIIEDIYKVLENE